MSKRFQNRLKARASAQRRQYFEIIAKKEAPVEQAQEGAERDTDVEADVHPSVPGLG